MSPRNIVKTLKKGGVGVIPTDTIYGIVGLAFSKEAVEQIYRLRKRDKKKLLIVLIGSFGDLRKFGVKVSKEHLNILKILWLGLARPSRKASAGAVSVILPTPSKKFSYLHRGKKTIAFRLPRDKWLRNFLQKTGPLVAPSANISGKPPAETISQAKRYFGNKVDFYVDRGRRGGKPSNIVELKR